MISAAGDFGNLAKDYEIGRQGYPQQVMAEVERYIGRDTKCILDVGCGTGQSTRLLTKTGCSVIGVDTDALCLGIAQARGGSNLEYQLASAENLPFSDAMFGAVTAFGSFHWWYRFAGALDSVLRVLRENGHFIVVNKDEVGSFGKEMRKIVSKYCAGSLADAKRGYDPVKFLSADCRLHVTTTQLPHEEVFTLPQLVAQIRSMSSWNAIPQARRNEATKAVVDHFSPHLRDGLYTRPLLIRVVTACKKDGEGMPQNTQGN